MDINKKLKQTVIKAFCSVFPDHTYFFNKKEILIKASKKKRFGDYWPHLFICIGWVHTVHSKP